MENYKGKRMDEKDQAIRDREYLSAAMPIWNGPAKDFMKEYLKIQPLYNGTSLQKKYYPRHYNEYLKTEHDKL